MAVSEPTEAPPPGLRRPSSTGSPALRDTALRALPSSEFCATANPASATVRIAALMSTARRRRAPAARTPASTALRRALRSRSPSPGGVGVCLRPIMVLLPCLETARAYGRRRDRTSLRRTSASARAGIPSGEEDPMAVRDRAGLAHALLDRCRIDTGGLTEQ